MTKLLCLNQMAGPLFRQLVEKIADSSEDLVELVSGHPDLFDNPKTSKNLVVIKAPTYNRNSRVTRLLSWSAYLVVATSKLIRLKKDDAVILSTNPPLLVLLVFAISKVIGFRYLCMIYDIYPDVLLRKGLISENNLITKIWRNLNRLAYKRAEMVVTLGTRMAHNLESHYLPLSVRVLRPWVDTKKIVPVQRQDNPTIGHFSSFGDFVVLYSGNIGAAHDIESIIGAAKLLQNCKNVKFVFIGDGEKSSAVKDYIRDYPNGNVSLHPFQAEHRLKYTLSIADVSLVTLDEGMEDLMVPSKFFYYLAAGSAVIGICKKNSELGDLIIGEEIGYLVPQGSPKKLAVKILSLYRNRQKLSIFKFNARKQAEERHSLNAKCKDIQHLMQSLKLRVSNDSY